MHLEFITKYSYHRFNLFLRSQDLQNAYVFYRLKKLNKYNDADQPTQELFVPLKVLIVLKELIREVQYIAHKG